MQEINIINLSEQDIDWVKKLFDKNTKVLGNMSGGTFFYRYMKYKADNEFMIGVRPLCFAHYRKRKKDGVNVLYEIVVDEKYQRKGLAELLIRYIDKPLELKTDTEHIPSNQLYEKLGFVLVGESKAKSGKKLNTWEWKNGFNNI